MELRLSTGTIVPSESVPELELDVRQTVRMEHSAIALEIPSGNRTFNHVLNEWTMTEMLKKEPETNHAQLVKDLVLALRQSEEGRADPLRTPKLVLPFVGLLVTGLISAGIMWAKVAAIESKMQAVDSISVVAAQVTSLQGQLANETLRLQQSQARLEDRIEKLIQQQATRERVR